jgi:hypothetical protein
MPVAHVQPLRKKEHSCNLWARNECPWLICLTSEFFHLMFGVALSSSVFWLSKRLSTDLKWCSGMLGGRHNGKPYSTCDWRVHRREMCVLSSRHDLHVRHRLWSIPLGQRNWSGWARDMLLCMETTRGQWVYHYRRASSHGIGVASYHAHHLHSTRDAAYAELLSQATSHDRAKWTLDRFARFYRYTRAGTTSRTSEKRFGAHFSVLQCYEIDIYATCWV